MPLAVILVALTAGSELSRARGGYIWTLAVSGIVAGVESQSSTPSEGSACQPPEWLRGVWIFSDATLTQGGMTTTSSNPNMAMSPTKLTFTPGSPTYEYAGGGLLPGRGEITSVSGGVVKAAIWPRYVKIGSTSPVTIARTTKGIAVAFSFTYPGANSQVSATYTRVPDRLELPGWLPGRWAFIRGMDTEMGSLRGSTIKLVPMTLVFTQGSPTYDSTGGPSSMGKDVIISIKNGMITLCFAPYLGTGRTTLSQAPEGVALEVFIREGFNLRLMSFLRDVSGIPTSGTNLIIVAAVNNVLHFRIFDGDGNVVVDTDEKSLQREQAQRIEDLRGQLKSLWPPHELTRGDKDRVIHAVGEIVCHGLHLDPTPFWTGSKLSYKAIYTRVEDHPVLPAWLPGWWVLGRSTMSRAGVTTTLVLCHG